MSQERLVFQGGTSEVIEKKSRFLGKVYLVESEEEVLLILEKVRKKYWNASHNCFAYILGDRGQVQRASDDGEPSGTAGRPMLDVLLGQNLTNVLVIVTRYFGGTLLGTGGLVRAYSQTTQEALEASVLVDRLHGIHLVIDTDYNGVGKIQYLLGQRKIPILHAKYTDQVRMEVLIETEIKGKLIADITEATSGRAVITEVEELDFAIVEGTPVYGEELIMNKELEA